MAHFKIFLLNVSVIILYLCVKDTVGVRGTVGVVHTVGVDLFGATKKAIVKQEQYLKHWRDLRRVGEITKGRYTLKSGRRAPIYRFEGETVQKMKLKEVFVMLQNWLLLQKGAKHSLVEMDIGGEKYRCRIHLWNRGILIRDEQGHINGYIKHYFPVLDAENVQEKVRAMLQSSREPLNAQTRWNEDMVGDKATRDKMREFMFVTQVAEAARPTGESLRELQRVMDDVTSQMENSKPREWDDKMTKLLSDRRSSLNEEQYEMIENRLLIKNAQWRELEQLRENKLELLSANTAEKIILALEQTDVNVQESMDELIGTANGIISSVHELAQIDSKFREWDDRVTQLLSDGSLHMSEEQYTMLKERLFIDNGQTQKLEQLRELEQVKENKRVRIASLSRVTPDDIDALLNLPENVVLPQEFMNDLTDAAKEIISDVTESVKRSWLRGVGNYRPRNGRSPVADKKVRRIFQKMLEGDFPSFKDAFETIFPNMQRGGTQRGRMEMFDLGHESNELSDSESEESPPQSRKRRRPGAKESAVVDGDRSWINDQVRLPGSPCGRRLKRDGPCTQERLKIVDDSFSWEGETLYYQTIDGDGRKATHAVEAVLSNMAAPEFAEERHSNLRESLIRGTRSTGNALGVYGATVGILASIQYFSHGEYGRGAFSAIQATHTIGGLTGINDALGKITKEVLKKTVTITVEKIGLEKTLQRMSELGTRALGKSASKVLGRLLEDVPVVGLAFDIYFIQEDIKDIYDTDSTTPKDLRIIHLILDLDSTALMLIEIVQPELIPFIEPIIIVNTIVRLSIDDFYLDIGDELAKVKGQSPWRRILAFGKGLEYAHDDLLTWGVLSQIKALEQQRDLDRLLLRNLSNPASYFNVTFQGLGENGEIVGTVDFTAGIRSQFGGFLNVMLNENGSFTVELPYVPTESGTPTRVVRTFTFSYPVNDLVLGVGEIANPRYIHSAAKLWLLIPVAGFDIIDGLEPHQSSRYGIYTGNSQQNNFYAVRGGRKRRKRSTLYKRPRFRRTSQVECVSSSEIMVHLNNYHYDLYGRGGDDLFFLGPQTARVSGEAGSDLYYIQANGGRAIIDNFARDQEMDTLFLNVSYEEIRCLRENWDLLVTYCQGTYHAVKIKEWFSHDNEQFYRHLYLATQDGVVIEVAGTEFNKSQYQVACNAVTVDKSSSTSAETLNLTGSLSEVKQVTGSNYSDVIIGNEKPNILRGGLGDDEITGANGSDIYIVDFCSGRDTIDNYATDEQEDIIIFGASFVDISLEISNRADLVMRHPGTTTQVTLKSWLWGSEWQHVVFVSSDYIRFVVKDDNHGAPRKYPLIIDLSEYQHGIRLNLLNSSDNEHIHVDARLADEIKTVMDSPYDDNIIGNSLGNFLSCTGGRDILQGNGGRDTYVINDGCRSVVIDNIDGKKDYDMVLLNCSNRNIRLYAAGLHLHVRCNLTNGDLSVHIVRWFQSPEQRHLILKTSDKITASLPDTTEELHLSRGFLYPYQIEADENCNGEIRIMDLNVLPWTKCERFVAKTDLCSYEIIGNELNNYIDPGPGNPFGFQILRGNNGTDTYVMGHRYGSFNIIDNFAEDQGTDHLKFNVIFHDIVVSRDSSNVTLTSGSRNDSVIAIVVNYFNGMEYQHLLVHSFDGVVFRISETFPYIEVLIVDFSTSIYSQLISATRETPIDTARILIGSRVAENHIEGGGNTTKIIGGQRNDTIIGGPEGEDLIGLDGHDVIHGGPGNDGIYGGEGDDFLDGGHGDDVFYGGMGADTILGGPGSNTVVFSGYNSTGVSINLQIGLGWEADAEGDSYEMITNIQSSEYDDFLIGNDENNIIRAYGGQDFIFPAGGDDILQGGRGSDVYQLNNAFGHKVINNFATDEELDLLIMNKTSVDAICYHFHGEDLQLTVDFEIANSTETVSRVLLGEVFLMITLPFWLRNSTYQHIAFSLSDGFLTPEDFDDSQRQLESTISLVSSGRLFQGVKVIGNSIVLTFDGRLWNDSVVENVILQYVHVEYNSTTYHHLSLPPPETVTINDLAAGTTHGFILIMSSCQLNVANSPVSYGTIPSNQPIGLVVNPILDGFVLSWTPQSSQSDPFGEEYEYIVKVFSDEPAEYYFEQITNSSTSTISLFGLIPGNEYTISVGTLVYNTTLRVMQVTARTDESACANLFHLSSHLRVEGSTRDEQGNTVATVRCETGYILQGERDFICNNSTSFLPNCTRTVCALPMVNNALLMLNFDGEDIPKAKYGQIFTWMCVPGFEILPNGRDTFSSVCGHLSQWTPEIPTCLEIPKCTGMSAPQFGDVSAAAVYVGERVTYSCKPGYHLIGNAVNRCMRVGFGSRNGTGVLNFSSHAVRCLPQPCPALLPQSYGVYTSRRSQYVTGDRVELFCNDGYYARDDREFPERVELSCNGYDWNPQQRHCQSIFEVYSVTHYISYVDVYVGYAIPSREGLTVPVYLYPHACSQILPDFTMWDLDLATYFQSVRRIRCYGVRAALVNGPTHYEGILRISWTNGFAYVCIDMRSRNTVPEICSELGYHGYTSSVYHSADAVTTMYRSSHTNPTMLIPAQQQCNYRIRCRAMCDKLYLSNGNWQLGCPHTLEGQTCHFTCNPGYGRIGSSSRRCTAGGWTGSSSFCDGDL